MCSPWWWWRRPHWACAGVDRARENAVHARPSLDFAPWWDSAPCTQDEAVPATNRTLHRIRYWALNVTQSLHISLCWWTPAGIPIIHCRQASNVYLLQVVTCCRWALAACLWGRWGGFVFRLGTLAVGLAISPWCPYWRGSTIIVLHIDSFSNWGKEELRNGLYFKPRWETKLEISGTLRSWE